MFFAKLKMEGRISSYLVDHRDKFISVDKIAEDLHLEREIVLEAVWALTKKDLLLTTIEGTERLYKLNPTHPLMKHFELDAPPVKANNQYD